MGQLGPTSVIQAAEQYRDTGILIGHRGSSIH
jgi:hypothetical protein